MVTGSDTKHIYDIPISEPNQGHIHFIYLIMYTRLP